MSTAKRIAANSIYQLVGKAATLAISLVMVAFLTRKLGVQAYGNYATALTFSQLFAIIADFGISIYLLKKLSASGAFDEAGRRLLGLVTELRVVIAVVGALVALGITFFLPYDTAIRQAIAVALVAVVVQMVNGLYVTVLQSQLEMKYVSLSEVIGRSVMLIGVFIVLYYNMGVAAVLGAQIVGNVVNLIFTYLASSRFVKPKFSLSTKDWGTVLRASILIGFSSVLSFVYFKTDTLLLSVLPIPGRNNQIEVGLYGAAYKVLEILILLPGIILGSIFPLMAGAYIDKDEKRVKLLLNRSFELMLALGLAAGVGIRLFSSEIILVVAGAAFSAAIIPLSILAFAIPLNFTSSVFNYGLLALERQRELTILYAVAAVGNVAANIYFIPQYSYIAAAWVTVATEVVVLIGGYIIMNRLFSFHFKWKGTIMILLSVGVAAVASRLFIHYSVWLQIAVYLVVLMISGIPILKKLLSKDL